MTPTATVQELAREALKYLETHQRADGEAYVTTRADAPDWVSAMVQEAHAGMLPDDHRYVYIAEALENIAESDDPEDARHEWADGVLDTYNAELVAWLGSHAYRAGYCDEAQSEGLVSDSDGIYERIRAGQYVEACEVYGHVLAYLEVRADDLA